jgi:hypothetical protein
MSMAELQAMAKVNHMTITSSPAHLLLRLRSHGEDLALAVEMIEDSLTSWTVIGTPTAAIAKEHLSWSPRQSAHFLERATQYLMDHQLPQERVYAIYRSCAVVGTTPEDITASWGPPSRRRMSAVGDTVEFEYGYGVEGQHVDFLFRRDSLVGLQEVQ